MALLSRFLDAHKNELLEKGIRLRAMGERYPLPEPLLAKLDGVCEMTKGNKKLDLILALNYGSRAEIVSAARKLAGKVREGELSPEEITEEKFSSELYLPDVPDPELMIRTGGEMRLSNFLLWQLAYSEFYFTPKAWPDFDKDELIKAIEAYNHRERRYGGLI
jgi:undecaprenyl diphosphate synthase